MPTIESVGLFLAKSVTFTLIFWGIWFSLQHSGSSGQDAQTDGQMATYEKQTARVNQQLDVAEALQKRAEKNLSVQEEQARRLDSVLSTWEKQGAMQR